MNRKSPTKHIVKRHLRKGKSVPNYWRGQGSAEVRRILADPTIKTTHEKQYSVWYNVKGKDSKLWWGAPDSCTVFARNVQDVKQQLSNKFDHIALEKRPEIVVVKYKLEALLAKRLKPLLDVDTRTRSRMDRGYMLSEINLADINIPPVRSEGRLQDNLQHIKKSKGVPPIHLTPKSGKFEIEDGVHRVHAAQKLGYKSIPALVYYGD